MKQNVHSKHQHGSIHDLSANGEVSRELEQPLEERIEDLRHRLRIEAAVVEGAKNVIKLLERGNKDKSDKKALQEVGIRGKLTVAELFGMELYLQPEGI